MQDQEEWRPFPTCPAYEISSLGRVRRGSKPLKWKSHKDGYKRLTMTWLGKRIDRTVHSVVAETFHGPCPSGHVVAHKNGDKSDNRAVNLSYATHRANMLHQRMHMKSACPLLLVQNGKDRTGVNRASNHARGARHGMAKLTEEQVMAVHKLYDNGSRSGCSVAKELGIGTASVHAILAGRAWRHLHPDVTLHR